MNFTQAVNDIFVAAGQEDNSIDIVIYYNEPGYDRSWVTLTAPRYFNDEKGTLETVKRAWECYCRGDVQKLESITSIEVVPTNKSFLPKAKKRITA